MKKFTLLFLFFSLALSAQVFPEYDLSLVVGHKVKPSIDDGIKTNGYKLYYDQANLFNKYKVSNGSTPFEELFDRTFEVISYAPYANSKTNFVITLKDINNQEIIHYEHSVEGFFNDEIEIVDDIKLPPDYFCNYIEEENRTWMAKEHHVPTTTYFLVNLGNFGLVKYKIKEKLTPFIYVSTRSTKKEKSTNGNITLNLANNKKIIKQSTIYTKQINSEYTEYSALLLLNENDLLLLKENKLDNYQILSTENEIPYKEYTGVLQGVIDCFTKK